MSKGLKLTKCTILANTRSSLEGGAADVPVDCWQIFKSGLGNISGPYRIQPISAERPLFAYCDQERWGGGWTVKN